MYLHNTPIGRPVYLNLGPVSVFGTSKQYVFSTQIFEPFAGNQSPTIVFRLYASSVTAFSLSCTLAGELS
jgi:hypothetical protein